MFGIEAPKYFKKHISVIPVKGKRPLIENWNHFCEARPSETEQNQWVSRYRENGISMCLGPVNGIIALDDDSDNPEIAALCERILGKSPLGKKGRRGATYFYQFDFEDFHENSRSIYKYDDQGKVLEGIELLFRKHTVIPPSIHPDTHKAFEWLGDQEIDLGDLPYLELSNIDELFYVLEKQYGYNNKPSKMGALSGGRNDTLKSLCASYIQKRLPMDEAIKNLIEEDKKLHASPLFLDIKEFRYDNPFYNATKFYLSNLNSVINRNIREGKALELPGSVSGGDNDDAQWAKECNFFYKDKAPLYYEMGDHFRDKKHFIWTPQFELIWNGTHYEITNIVEIKKQIGSLTGRRAKTPNVKSAFYDAIKTECCKLYDKLKETDGLINLRNGILCPKTKKLIPHNSEYNFQYVIDLEYDAEAQCPIWERTLLEIFNDDLETIELIRQIGAYILIGGYPFLHKAFFFTGSGRNGKSTVLWVLERLLGRENISSLSMTQIDQPFHTVLMHKKLANLCEEFPVQKINSEQFKNIVGGGSVLMSHKHKDVFEEPVHARLIFAVNSMPTFDKDKSVGLMDRLVFINFPNYFASWERDYHLKSKLKKELPGILNFFLEALPFPNNFQLSEGGASKKLKKEFTHKSDTVRAYFEHALEVTENEFDQLSNTQLYDYYKTFMEESNKGGAEGQYIAGKKRFLSSLKDFVTIALKEAKIPMTKLEYRDMHSRGICHIKTKQYDIEDI